MREKQNSKIELAPNSSMKASEMKALRTSASIFRSLPNDILLAEVKSLVRRERALQADFLEALREIDQRKLYLEYECANLFEFMTKELGYSAGPAQRRIDAARLSIAVPEVISKVKEGSVNLSTLSRLQSVIKTEERLKREKLGVEMKKNLVIEITNRTLRETDQVLFQKLPEASLKAEALRKESVRAVSPDQSRMTLLISSGLREKLERLQEVVSHKTPGPGLEPVLELAIDEYLKRFDPLKKAERSVRVGPKSARTLNFGVGKGTSSSEVTQGSADMTSNRKAHEASVGAASNMKDGEGPTGVISEVKDDGVSPELTSKVGDSKGFPESPPNLEVNKGSSEYPSNLEVSLNLQKPCSASQDKKMGSQRVAIPARTKHLVFLRDKARCQAQDARTGKICGSRRYIELDHRVPVAKGGGNEVGNLRCVCREHNRAFAEKVFGKNWMAQFR